VDARVRLASDFFEVWFSDPVPIFEGGFHIAREEIQRAQEVVRVRIARVQPQDMLDQRSRLRTVSQLESYTRPFKGKSLVGRGFDLALLKGSFSFPPLL